MGWFACDWFSAIDVVIITLFCIIKHKLFHNFEVLQSSDNRTCVMLFYLPLQVNFLQDDSPLSLSSMSALDGVKQEVMVLRIMQVLQMQHSIYSEHKQATLTLLLV